MNITANGRMNAKRDEPTKNHKRVALIVNTFRWQHHCNTSLPYCQYPN